MTSASTERAARQTRADDGFTLLDVLVGLAIFALLAIIAVSGFSQYRLRAFESAALADARRLGEALSAASFDDQAAPQALGRVAPGWAMNASARKQIARQAAASRAAQASDLPLSMTDPLTATGLTLYPGNRIAHWGAAAIDDFSFCVEHLSDGKPDAWAWYDSENGGIIGHGRGTGVDGTCPKHPGGSDDAEPQIPGGSGGGGSTGGSGGGGGTTGGGGSTPSTPPEPTPPPVVDPTPPPPPTPTPTPTPEPEPCPTAIKVDASLTGSLAGLTANLFASISTAFEQATNADIWLGFYQPLDSMVSLNVDPISGASVTANREITVYTGPGSLIGAQICGIANLNTVTQAAGADPTATFAATGGTYYYVRVHADIPQPVEVLSAFSLPGTNDTWLLPLGINASPASTRTFENAETSNFWATAELGENTNKGTRSVWYRLANASPVGLLDKPKYTLEILPPTNGAPAVGQHTVEVYANGVTAILPGNLVASASGTGSSSVTFTGPTGIGELRVRVVSPEGQGGFYRLRLARQ